MKKIKNSVKVIIGSIVAVLCVTAIVLGCVFGIKKPNPNNPSDPSNPNVPVDPYKFTQAQSSLADDLKQNIEATKTKSEIIDSAVYSGYCTISQIDSYGSNYFIAIDSSNDYHVFIYKNNGESVDVKELTDRSNFNFRVGQCMAIANNTNYVAIVSLDTDSNYLISIVCFEDFENPVEIFRVKSTAEKLINLETINLNDEFFSYVEFYDYNEDSVEEGWFNVYAYKLQNSKIEDETIENKNNVIEKSSDMYNNLYFDDNYVATKNENGFNVLYVNGSEILKATFEIAATDNVAINQLNGNNILVSTKEHIDLNSANKNTVLEEDKYYNYSYKLLNFANGTTKITDLELGDYAYISTIDSSFMNISDHFVLFKQKVDEEFNLKNEYLCTYYDNSFNKVLEYTSNEQERILSASDNSFLTTKRLISTKESMEITNRYEFVNTIVDGKYELYSKTLKGQYLTIRAKGGLYGLMDMKGNVVINPEEFSFEPLVVGDDYAIGLHTEEIVQEEGANLKTEEYYKYNFANKQFSKINFVDDANFKQLMESGFEGYFAFDDDASEYTLHYLDGNKKLEHIIRANFIKTQDGAMVEFTLAGNKKVNLNIKSEFAFTYKSADGGSEALSSDINSYTIDYNGNSFSTSIGTAFYVYLYPDKGQYYTSYVLKFKWTKTYTTTVTSLSQTEYKYNTSRPTFGTADIYYSDSSRYSYSNGYIKASVAIDYDDYNKFQAWEDSSSADYAKYKITLDKNGGSGGTDTIYKWYYLGFSTSESSFEFNSFLFPSRNGYTFAGYFSSTASYATQYIYTDYSCSSSSYQSTGNRTFYAHWTANTYNVTVDANGGSGSTTFTAAYDVWKSFETPTRIGYTLTKLVVTGFSYYDDHYIGSSTSNYTTHASGVMNITPMEYTPTGSYTYIKNIQDYTGANVTITAYWQVNTYNIVRDLAGGSGPLTSLTATYDSNSSCNNPTRTGYTFTGWYLSGMDSVTHYMGTSHGSYSSTSTSTTWTYTGSATNTVTSYKNLTSVQGATVYWTAQWRANTYTISRDLAGGTGSQISVTAIYDNASFGHNPTRVGYTFTGWYISGMSTDCTHSLGNSTSTDSFPYSTNSSSTTYTGSASSTVTSYKNLTSVNGATVYWTAQWRANTYTISRNLAGGTGPATSTTATYDSNSSCNNPTRTGYIFTGWYVSGMDNGVTHYLGSATNSYSSSTSTTWTYTGSATSTVTSYKNLSSVQSATVYWTAQWTPITYKVTRNLNGGSGNTTEYTTAYDSWGTGLANPTRTGYTFTGWYVTGMDNVTHNMGSSTGSYSSSTSTTWTYQGSASNGSTYYRNLTSVNGATVTLTAQWRANTYTINRNLAGGTGPATTTATYDADSSCSNPTRIGYIFTGWAISGMDSVTHYLGTSSGSYETTLTSTSTTYTGSASSANTSYKNLHSTQGATVNWTAQWRPITYNIVYDFNVGGAGVGSYPTSATFDSSFMVDNAKLAPEGYHFAGWSLSGLANNTIKYYGSNSSTSNQIASGTTTGRVYTFRDNYAQTYFKNLISTEGGTVTLTAVWDPNTYNINYTLTDTKGGDGRFTGSYPTTAEYNSFVTIPDPIRTGYTFIGWSLTGLADDCVHYYSDTTSGGTQFSSQGGQFVMPDNPNELFVVEKTHSNFKNLHKELNATVNLIAVWRANDYTITYHFIPSNFDTSTLSETTLNRSNIMTATKTQVVTYDSYFILPKATSNETDPLNITLPDDVKLLYWAFYTTPSSDYTLASGSSGSYVPTNPKYFAAGTEQTYNVYGADAHAYAVYDFVDINLEYYGTDVTGNINDITKYGKILTGSARTYSNITLPATINGKKIVGYMISSNRLDKGLLNKGSISEYTAGGVNYRAESGKVISWGYSSKLAYDLENPTFYLYAIYEVEFYTVHFDAIQPGASSYTPTGYISPMEIANGASAALPTGGITLTGYTLDSWVLYNVYTNELLTTIAPGGQFNPSEYELYINKNVTVHAAWKQNTYNITYELNGGSYVSGGTYPTSAKFDEWFKVSPLTKEGYILTEYYVKGLTTYQARYYGSSTTSYSTSTSGGNTIRRSSSTGITSDYYYKNLRSESGTVTFVAVWTPITYTLSYNFGDGTTATQTVKYDEWFKPLAPKARIGYRNNGYLNFNNLTNSTHCSYFGSTPPTASTSPSGTFTGTSYNSGVIDWYRKNLRNTSGTVNVTYQWLINTYNVTYVYGNGTANETITAQYNVGYTMKIPTRKGYVCTGYHMTGLDTNTHFIGDTPLWHFTQYNTTSLQISDLTQDRYQSLNATHNANVTVTFEWGLIENGGNLRYLRLTGNGSNQNAGTHYSRLYVNKTDGSRLTLIDANAAIGPEYCIGDTVLYGNESVGSPGSTWEGAYYQGSGTEIGNVIVMDIGSWVNAKSVTIRRYYPDGRYYYGCKIEGSVDGVNWYIIYNSYNEGSYGNDITWNTYAETSAGKTYEITDDLLNMDDMMNFINYNEGIHDNGGRPIVKNADGSYTAWGESGGSWNIKSGEHLTYMYKVNNLPAGKYRFRFHATTVQTDPAKSSVGFNLYHHPDDSLDNYSYYVTNYVYCNITEYSCVFNIKDGYVDFGINWSWGDATTFSDIKLEYLGLAGDGENFIQRTDENQGTDQVATISYMNIDYNADTRTYTLTNTSSGDDPYATVAGQTVYLQTGKTYLMHANAHDGTGVAAERVRIFYAINQNYSEDNFQWFSGEMDREFAVKETGYYNIRFDNEYKYGANDKVYVSDFWIKEISDRVVYDYIDNWGQEYYISDTYNTTRFYLGSSYNETIFKVGTSIMLSVQFDTLENFSSIDVNDYHITEGVHYSIYGNTSSGANWIIINYTITESMRNDYWLGQHSFIDFNFNNPTTSTRHNIVDIEVFKIIQSETGNAGLKYPNLNTITVSTADGWEIIGTEVNVSTNTTYKLTFNAELPSDFAPLSAVDSGSPDCDGLGVLITYASPVENDCQSIRIERYKIRLDNQGYVSFTFNTGSYSKIWIILNFGYVADGKNYTFYFSNWTLKKDGSFSNEMDPNMAKWTIYYHPEAFTEIIGTELDLMTAPIKDLSKFIVVESVDDFMSGEHSAYNYIAVPKAIVESNYSKIYDFGREFVCLEYKNDTYYYYVPVSLYDGLTDKSNYRVIVRNPKNS